MEVHHHPASNRDHSARKKWHHYFFEFLMLFLAVFAGFLAENQREHIVEKRREKDYIRSLIDDLKTDTSYFNPAIKDRKQTRLMVDSLIGLLAKKTRSE